MARRIRYLSHPQVRIDPDQDITSWSLNDVGRARVQALAVSDGLKETQHVISSAETKALETAHPLAKALGCSVVVRVQVRLRPENERSATGFLPPDEFETVADEFFAKPDQSVRGWETASAAQHRIVTEVSACLQLYPAGDLLFVGHGAVGTLLFCQLSGLTISRAYDQGPGGGGCYFEFSDIQPTPKNGWQMMENLYA
jgi:broad specificity phosphatase PhoE